jgi:hypothetical protein
MSIKSLAHLAHQRVAAAVGPVFKRSHFYELTAAAFGYGSYAALGAESVLFNSSSPVPELTASRVAAVREKCISLGYTAQVSEVIASAICSLLNECGLSFIRLDDLVDLLRQRNHEDPWQVDESRRDYGEEELDDVPEDADRELSIEDFMLPSTKELPAWVLLESLQAAAQRGSAQAHYAIALLHEPDSHDEDDRGVSPYWYTQRKAGAELSGAKADWADAYEQQEFSKVEHEMYLRAAAKLGYKEALVDLAQHFGDPAVFDMHVDLSDKDPAWMADLARSLGRPDQEKRWLTIAAELGDTEAMRDLIEGYDAGDLKACWKWLYLAELHGEDLTQNHHHAINDDGSPYDDDVGGPMYVGGLDGVSLERLSADEDLQSKDAALEIYRTR